MKNLVIIGASALAREVAEMLLDIKSDVKLKGFLDSRKNILDSFSGLPPIIGDAETYEIQPDDVFVCALGEPEMRKKYVDMISARGGKFISDGVLRKEITQLKKSELSWLNEVSNNVEKQAVKDALDGKNNIGSRLYFNGYNYEKNRGHKNAVRISNHLFW